MACLRPAARPPVLTSASCLVGVGGAGSPSPMAVMRDAEALVRHVRKELGATRIAVHGESIGGMVACHVARHCEGVELLVADRTFSTLSAVADRLMFSWAGAALHFFTGTAAAAAPGQRHRRAGFLLPESELRTHSGRHGGWCQAGRRRTWCRTTCRRPATSWCAPTPTTPSSPRQPRSRSVTPTYSQPPTRPDPASPASVTEGLLHASIDDGWTDGRWAWR